MFEHMQVRTVQLPEVHVVGPGGAYAVFRFEQRYVGSFWDTICTPENQAAYRIDLSVPRYEAITSELQRDGMVEWYIPSV